MALEELRTPPTEAPPLPELMLAVELPEDDEEEELPPPAFDVTEPARELGVLPPLLLDPLLEDPLEEDPPPPLDPPLLLPPPRLRPMNAPPPPPKLRLPRNCGPRIVTYCSGPVVPVNRNVCSNFPPLTVAVRVAVVKARLAATASSAKFF
ncbi:MAG: hypothetical protein U0R19_29735 [Bryobacteraceae bacterium]